MSDLNVLPCYKPSDFFLFCKRKPSDVFLLSPTITHLVSKNCCHRRWMSKCSATYSDVTNEAETESVIPPADKTYQCCKYIYDLSKMRLRLNPFRWLIEPVCRMASLGVWKVVSRELGEPVKPKELCCITYSCPRRTIYHFHAAVNPSWSVFTWAGEDQ